MPCWLGSYVLQRIRAVVDVRWGYLSILGRYRLGLFFTDTIILVVIISWRSTSCLIHYAVLSMHPRFFAVPSSRRDAIPQENRSNNHIVN